MEKEILLTNLSKLVINKTCLATGEDYKKWLVLPYETGEFKGEMLVFMDNFEPQKAEIALQVMGWYKIYLGIVSFGGQNALGVQIANGGKTIIEPKMRMNCWQKHEWIEENFFRAMNLTNKTLSIFKPSSGGKNFSCGLAYIRLVAMTEEEIAEYTKTQGGCGAFHFDTDFTHETDYQTVQELMGRLEMLENTNGGELFYETSFDDCPIRKPEKHIFYSTYNETICERYSKYLQNGKENRKAIIQKAHDMGYKVYATNRMEMGDFNFPYSVYTYNNGIAEKYPEYKCKTRDGRVVNALSFAYPQVRELAINRLMNMLSEGFDGLGLIFHRGIHVAFEQPIIDRVWELYGIDARKLSFADKRLHTVLCEFMTTFMRELRQKVYTMYGNTKKIHVIVYYDAVSSKNFGLDVEMWAKENLIDGICQGLMMHFENLENCLDENGLIDLIKFQSENAKRPILNRIFGSDKTMIVEGAKTFKACQKYGKTFYGTLLWECDTPESTMEIATALKQVGVEKFFSWNSNHKAKNLLLINTEKAIARKDTCQPTKYIRILSIAGGDISSFNQNWRG